MEDLADLDPYSTANNSVLSTTVWILINISSSYYCGIKKICRLVPYTTEVYQPSIFMETVNGFCKFLKTEEKS